MSFINSSIAILGINEFGRTNAGGGGGDDTSNDFINSGGTSGGGGGGSSSCVPDSVYGPFYQTLFLGCSIMSFSASAGWNGQQSEITVLLVEDTCEAPAGFPKRYYDTNIELQEWTDPDPGFYGLLGEDPDVDFNLIGAPVYFRVGNFEFSGIVQSWEEVHSESANPTYQVKIVDPSRLLSNTQIIINEYADSVGGLFNVFNVFGFLEQFGTACPSWYQSSPALYQQGIPSPINPDGVVFGAAPQAYGGANSNNNGLKWNEDGPNNWRTMKSAVRASISTYPLLTDSWSPYGRIVFKGPGTETPTEGMGLLDTGKLTEYLLDIDELPEAPNYWRFNGINTPVMDIVTQLCEDSGHDYMIELLPVHKDPDDPDSIIKPLLFIKIRAVDRRVEPTPNAIETYVQDEELQKRLMNYNKGEELRNELTEALVLGGPKQNFYQAERLNAAEINDIIMPFFGLNPDNGDLIIPSLDNYGFWQFTAFTDELSFQLANTKYNKSVPRNVVINERELIMAQTSFDVWASYASGKPTPLWIALGLTTKSVFNQNHIINLIKNVNTEIKGQNDIAPGDVPDTELNVVKNHEDIELEVQQIAYAWIRKIADEYYGKKFQVRVPENSVCGKYDLTSGQAFTSEEPTDGGWTEVTPVLQLAHPSAYTDFFTLTDNRLGAFCRFDGAAGLEVSNLSINDFVTYNNSIWMKLEIDNEFVYRDKSTFYAPAVVVSVPQVMRKVKPTENTNFPIAWGALEVLITDFFTDPDITNEKIENTLLNVFQGAGTANAHIEILNRIELPDACGFGIKSNVLTYGPWKINGKAGATRITHEDGLNPWDFGGFDTLNAAGNELALQGLTNQQVADEGQITIVGYPNMPLGAELLSGIAGGPFEDTTGANLIENRTVLQYYINYPTGLIRCLAVNMPKSEGTYGPNITGISTGVGPQGAQTTFTMRTWSPKFGNFARGNIERIKQIGQNRLRNQKALRSYANNRIKTNNAFLLKSNANRNRSGNLFDGRFTTPRTPSSVFAGKKLGWNDGAFQRPNVASIPIHEVGLETAEDYANKALMSLDGLIRPVSNNTNSDLPPYATALGNCQITMSKGFQTPIDKAGEAGQLNQYNLDIDIDYLNPFDIPSGVLPGRSDTDNHGHDIEVLAHGSVAPAHSMTGPIQGYNAETDLSKSSYDSDYRMLALRGPLLMQGWGYDLDGFPIPNKADEGGSPEQGNFTETDLQHKFLDNWLRKSETWPVGPVDLRWDRERAVWTVPQQRDVFGTVTQQINPYSEGEAVVNEGPTLYDGSGVEIESPEFKVWDKVGNTINVGNRIVARFNPVDCKYYVIESLAGSSSCDFIRFEVLSETVGETGTCEEGLQGFVVDIKSMPCGCATVPGFDEQGQYKVWDTTCKILSGINYIGQQGFAKYLEPIDCTDYADCRWEIVDLCCPTQQVQLVTSVDTEGADEYTGSEDNCVGFERITAHLCFTPGTKQTLCSDEECPDIPCPSGDIGGPY